MEKLKAFFSDFTAYFKIKSDQAILFQTGFY